MENAALVGSIATTLGVLSSTGFFAMNTTINYVTMPTLLLGAPIRADAETDKSTFFSTVLGEPLTSRHPRASREAILPSTPVPVSRITHLNRQWKELYWRGHRYGPVSSIFSTSCFLAAAWCTRPRGSLSGGLMQIAGVNVGLRTCIYVAAAACAFFAGPYTLIVMVPGANDELHARGDRVAAREGLEGKKADKSSSASKDSGSDDEEETLRLITKWVYYSKVRAAAGGIAALLGAVGSYL